MARRRQLVFRIAVWLIVFLLLPPLALPMFADQLIYFPNYASRQAPVGTRKILSEVGDIAVLHLPNPNARFTLWFFHGNAEALGDLEPFLRSLRDLGFAVCAFDYPGYGQSAGTPNEKTVYASARAVRKFLREELKVPADRTLICGRSLGGGPALQMAIEERPAGVILLSTFTSTFRVVTRWRLLPFDPYQNLSKIGRVNCPVLVMHGRADEVIPFHHGEALFARAKEPKRHLWIDDAGHNDFVAAAGPRFGEALASFSALCASSAAASP